MDTLYSFPSEIYLKRSKRVGHPESTIRYTSGTMITQVPMVTYYFYLLRCSDNSLYAGITTDVQRRLQEHNSSTKKRSKYVRSRQPVRLVYQEEYMSKSEALRREAEVKRWKKKEKEKLVMNNE